MKAMREGKKMSESEIRATSERLYRGVGVVEREGGTTPRRRAKEERAAACTFTPKISAASRGNWRKSLRKTTVTAAAVAGGRQKTPQEAARRRRLADDRGDVDDAGARRVGRDRRALHVPADHFSKIAGDSREFGASSVERDEDAVVVRRALQGVGATQGGDSRVEKPAKREGDLRDCTFQPVTCAATSSSPMAVAKTPTPGLESYLRATGTRSKDARGEGR